MTFLVTVVQDEDGMYIAECPAIPGCVGQGTTEEKAERDVKQAILACINVRQELGMPISVPVHQVEITV